VNAQLHINLFHIKNKVNYIYISAVEKVIWSLAFNNANLIFIT